MSRCGGVSYLQLTWIATLKTEISKSEAARDAGQRFIARVGRRSRPNRLPSYQAEFFRPGVSRSSYQAEFGQSRPRDWSLWAALTGSAREGPQICQSTDSLTRRIFLCGESACPVIRRNSSSLESAGQVTRRNFASPGHGMSHSGRLSLALLGKAPTPLSAASGLGLGPL